MKILILHGIGGHAGIHWQQWLHDQLTERGHDVFMPDLPDGTHPDRRVWLDTVKQTLAGVNPGDLIIVGHSLGVTTALDYLETISGKVRALVSVAGIGDDYGAELNSYFLAEKLVDYEGVREHLRRAAVIYGDDDPYVPQAVLDKLAVALGVEPEVVAKGGHLNTDAGFTKFPRLLDIVLDLAA